MIRPFVNRVEEIRVLKQALNYDNQDNPVLVFTGIGGMGKTALRLAFEEQVLKPNNVPYVVVDYDGDPNLRSIEATLRTIRRQLGRHKVKTPVFDYLYARYFELSMGVKISADNCPPELEGVVTVLEGLPGVGQVTQIIHGLTKLGLAMKERLQHKEWMYRLRDLEPREVLSLLPEVLAEDLEEAMTTQSVAMLKTLGYRLPLFFDAYERLAESQIDDTLHRKLLLGTPHLLRIVLTRDPLPWEQRYPKEWRGKIKHYPSLEVLARDDAVTFLSKKQIESPALHDHLYQLTGGYPFHLELCADICGEIVESGQEPGVSDFEGLVQAHDLTEEELVARLLRQLAPEERDLMGLAAYPRWVTEEILEELSSIPESVPRIFHRFIGLSIFSPHPEIRESYVIRKEVRDGLLLKQQQRRQWKKQHSTLSKFHREHWEQTQSFHHLRETLYHGFYEDPEQAMKMFEDNFWKLLEGYRFGEAEGLLEAIPQETLNDVAKRKIDYARARLLTSAAHSQQSLITAKNLYETLIAAETDEDSLSKYLFSLGENLCVQSEYAKALEHYEKALAIRLKIYGEKHPAVADVYNNIGAVYTEQGEYEKAREYLQKSLTIHLKIYGGEHPAIAKSYNSIGVIYYYQAEYGKALEYFQKTLAIRLKICGEKHPAVGDSYNNIGNVYEKQGEYEKALEYYQKDLAICLEIFGEEHPGAAGSYLNMGVTYYRQGEFEKAQEYFQKTLFIHMRIYGQVHRDVARSYDNLGVAHLGQGNFSQALENHQKSLVIRLKIYGEEHPEVAISYDNMGVAYCKQGEYGKALKYHQKALAVLLKTYTEDHPYVAASHNNIGNIYFDQGEYKKALEYYQKSLAIMSKAYVEHPAFAQSYSNIANTLWALMKKDEAIEKKQQSVTVYCKFSLWKNAVEDLETLTGWLEKMEMGKEADEARAEADKIRKDHGFLPKDTK